MMQRNEWFAGAPIRRGRWSAMFCLWWSGYSFGRTRIIREVWSEMYWGDWRNWFYIVMGCLFIALGVLFLDQYGRNCYFEWAPDEARWKKLSRGNVKRDTWFSWRRLRSPTSRRS